MVVFLFLGLCVCLCVCSVGGGGGGEGGEDLFCFAFALCFWVLLNEAKEAHHVLIDRGKLRTFVELEFLCLEIGINIAQKNCFCPNKLKGFFCDFFGK